MVFAAAVLLCLAGCREKPRPAPQPPTVEVTPVTKADVPVYHEWIGTLDGLVNATIRAQVTGYLLKQDYREGDAIKKGDLLFEIDPRPFQAVLDQAKGELVQAEARFGKTELDVKRYAPLRCYTGCYRGATCCTFSSPSRSAHPVPDHDSIPATRLCLNGLWSAKGKRFTVQ